MRVWIDLANSPHPLLFAPVARRLRELGAEVELTVRDHAQTVELATERWPDAEVIGGASPGGRGAKAAETLRRVGALRPWARSRRVDVALSHNSYAQLAAARSLGIPAVTGMDFEYQPANHLAFRCATKILVPAAIPPRALRRQGATAAKLIRYDGLKEQLYLGDFVPDRGVLERVGVDPQSGRALVVARTAPAGAVYHRGENPMLLRALESLGDRGDVDCVVLARHPEQREEIEALGSVIVPKTAVDGLSLVWYADLFLGAGGTMTREAALLGVPTYSLFAGKPPAVDAWLVRQGRLQRLAAPEDLPPVVPKREVRADIPQPRVQDEELVDLFARVTLETAG